MPMPKFRMTYVVDARKIQISSGALKMRISHSIINSNHHSCTDIEQLVLTYTWCASMFRQDERWRARMQRETERSKERDPAESRSEHWYAANYFNVIERLQPPLTAPLQPSVCEQTIHRHEAIVRMRCEQIFCRAMRDCFRYCFTMR